MQLPSEDDIKQLHKKYAPTEDAFNVVFTHCQIVWEVAQQLIHTGKPEVDVELVKVGCLLHDIGIYRLGDDAYITHGIHGEKLLRDEGFDEVICRFASHHTGVGIMIDGKEYQAETNEEKLVMYADKFHSKSGPSLNSYEWYKHYSEKFGQEAVERFIALAKQFGIPELESLSRKYGHEIRKVS